MELYFEVEESAYNYCMHQFKYIYGHFKEKPSYYAYFFMVTYIICVLHLMKSAITGFPSNQEVSLQFVCVGTMIMSMYTTVFYYRKKIMSIAEECDFFPVLDVPWDIKSSFKSIQISINNSFERKYCLVHNFMFGSVGVLFCLRPILMNLGFGTEIELVLTGSIIDPYEHAFWYLIQVVVVFSTALLCVTTLNLFSHIVFTIQAHYKLIEKAVMEPSESKNKEKFVKQCTMHLERLLKIFEGVEHVFKRVLFIVYFGMFLCAALTRGIFLKDIDISVIFLLLLCTIDETIYLSPFCVVMEALIKASQDLSFAIYSSDWLSYNTNVRRSYYLTMIRLTKSPNISIYPCGPNITLRSYLAVINGTFSFLMSAALLYLLDK